jgi:hypothetical protein
MHRSLPAALLLTALALPSAACDGIKNPFCGGSLDKFCGSNPCADTWEEALLKAQSDTGDFELIGCTEEAMLMVHGYMMGRTHYYDGASGELSAVVEWSDIQEFCADTSFTREWGEALPCDRSCTYQKERVSEYQPLCEDGN